MTRRFLRKTKSRQLRFPTGWPRWHLAKRLKPNQLRHLHPWKVWTSAAWRLTPRRRREISRILKRANLILLRCLMSRSRRRLREQLHNRPVWEILRWRRNRRPQKERQPSNSTVNPHGCETRKRRKLPTLQPPNRREVQQLPTRTENQIDCASNPIVTAL